MLPRPFVKRLKIHEQTQRALLQLSFVLLIALPTLLTILFVIVAQTSWYGGWRKASWERHLSQALGFVVSIERLEEIAPNHLLLIEATLQHPETGDEVMRLHRVDALNSDRRWGIWISRVDVSGDHLAYCWRTLHDWYICRPQQSGGKMLVRIDDLSIQGRVPLPGIVDLHCDIEPTNDQFVASLRYHHASDPKDEWIVAELERHHTTVVPKTEVQVQTGSLSLPLAFLHEPMPSLRILGEQTSFQGSVAIGYDSNGNYQVRHIGSLRSIQFDSIAAQTPHLFTGFGDLNRLEFTIENGILVRADGELTSRDRGGYLGRELVRAACDPRALGARIFQSLSEQLPARVRYDTLGFRFSIDSHGLKLSGMLQPLEDIREKAIVLGENQTLLFEPQASSIIELEKLVTLFHLPQSNVGVTNEHPIGKWIASRLPWPSLPSPQARVSLATP